MNFWKRYPADYARKTARLTLAQHGAYTLLLDELYTTEAPLPAAEEELFRVCRAMSKDEREAVRVVVARFFTGGPDGLHNNRAAEELTAAAPAVAAARENGKRGGRPAKPKTPHSRNPAGSENKTKSEPKSKAPHSSDSSSLRSEQPPSGVQGVKRRRCPEDWLPSVADIEKLRVECPGVDIDAETNLMRDWEFQKARTDWDAVFRTWIRKAFKDLQKPKGAKSFRERDADAAAARMAELSGGLLDRRSGIVIDMENPNARLAR